MDSLLFSPGQHFALGAPDIEKPEDYPLPPANETGHDLFYDTTE